jgi:predicted nucleic acid-binding protein
MRDLLMWLALTRKFRARWTEQIQDEWARNLLANRPDLGKEQVSRTITKMNEAVPDCLVTGYEHIIDQLDLPDPDDRHVLAAAIRSGAAAIVTTNLKDFPEAVLSEFDIFAIHPDDFIMDLADLEPQVLERAAKFQRANLTNPVIDGATFVETIRQQGLPQVASFLSDRIDLI